MDGGSGVVAPFSERFGDVLRRLRKQRGRRQIEISVEVPVDHSLVSRWETGGVLPTARDLRALQRILRLSDEERDELDYAWRRERDVDADHPLRTAEEWMGSLRVSVECVRGLRKSGQPRLALILSRRDARAAFEGLRSAAWSAGHARALAELSELLLEESKAGLDYLPSSAVRRGELVATVRMQGLVAEGSGDPTARTLHTIAKESISYVSGNYGDAHELGLALLDDVGQVPVEWIPEVIRACGINAGRIGCAETLTLTESALTRLVAERDDLPRGTQAFVLEGLARGWAGMDAAHAVTVIEAARSLREASEDSEGHSSLRYVQLVRTQAEVELALRSRGNRSDILRHIDAALCISEREGFDKYILEIQALGDRLS